MGGEKMAKNVDSKVQIVDEIKGKITDAKGIVLVDYIGLTVAQATELRNKYREAGIDFKVYKNTLINRAIEGMNVDEIIPELNGPTALAISKDDEVAPAKITYDFIKANDKMEIKCGIFNGLVSSKEDTITLASLPSREELLAKAVGSIKAPIMNFVYCINAIKEAKEKEA